ncbi:mitochondrial carrier [Mytilinidion resinicola]|uniref:Mitochondrial carrier n=1 Tax=Mytilinidion resinicola TaxID=574789 RepID=A0A6A6YZW4_9PEZI|nr:mitochondrial carrier [Mytilinidion resinicola]KAF2813465.1 mitochondrial carrier [Mytilinidion resinicola]
MSGNTNSDILLAGAFAAFTIDLLVYPLDTLKTRIQSPNYARIYTNAATSAVNKPALFRGLYQGVGSVIIATLPSSGAFFTTYERTKALLTHLNPTTASSPHGLIPTPLVHAAASSAAELVSCAILTPAEVIKQNAQMVDSTAKTSTNPTLQTLAKFRSNPLALWRGYTALAGRNLPFTALQFPLFERLKQGIRDRRERRGKLRGGLVESGLITAVSAGTAGAVSAVVTTPVDVVKTRIMLAATGDASAAQALNPLVRPEEKGRKSALAIGREIMREKGWRGLWRGGALRGVWTMIGSGLYLGVYESGRIYLAERGGESINEEDLF